MLKRLLLLAVVVVMPMAATAGTAVGESIWNKKAAIAAAMQSVPSGAQVTDTSCQEVEVGTGNYHYLCRITYTDPVNPSP